ncbi:MAG TPA: deoxyribodipyrimidine photo-lyase [Spirochaetota bacterium]|nr:deoxyribodipyrimidine photo-lyase [Spirochaetota bacterium]
MIQSERILALNSREPRQGDYVLYWMQQSQREEYNHALEYAARMANEYEKPLVVFFGLTGTFPEAQGRHYWFMLEGLKNTGKQLKERGIAFSIQLCSPEKGALEMSRRAVLVVTDRGYLRIQRTWREQAAAEMKCPLVQVESDVIVPVDTASWKEEYSAATLRPKIARLLHEYLVPLEKVSLNHGALRLDIMSEPVDDIQRIMDSLEVSREVKPVRWIQGGTTEAKKLLDAFCREKLPKYGEERNEPSRDFQSVMSPYLHFGQISPLFVALKIREHSGDSADAYIEELIVRRELSMNFIRYNENYDSFLSLPDWAKITLGAHTRDSRDYIYTLEELEQGKTHDPCWNAAQREMVYLGKMHGYMRMYWGKKIIEWSRTPEEAYEQALYLNNKYELDGRDPNGFTGVAWCFGKHDRAWKERPVFGKVRYMNENGLRRKFNMDAYISNVEQAINRERDS